MRSVTDNRENSDFSTSLFTRRTRYLTACSRRSTAIRIFFFVKQRVFALLPVSFLPVPVRASRNTSRLDPRFPDPTTAYGIYWPPVRPHRCRRRSFRFSLKICFQSECRPPRPRGIRSRTEDRNVGRKCNTIVVAQRRTQCRIGVWAPRARCLGPADKGR